MDTIFGTPCLIRMIQDDLENFDGITLLIPHFRSFHCNEWLFPGSLASLNDAFTSGLEAKHEEIVFVDFLSFYLSV